MEATQERTWITLITWASSVGHWCACGFVMGRKEELQREMEDEIARWKKMNQTLVVDGGQEAWKMHRVRRRGDDDDDDARAILSINWLRNYLSGSAQYFGPDSQASAISMRSVRSKPGSASRLGLISEHILRLIILSGGLAVRVSGTPFLMQMA